MFNRIEIITNEIKKYNFIAEEIEKGDFSHVEFKKAHDENGYICDGNYENRNCLVNLILTLNQELIREDIITKLFEEEVKSHENSDLGGLDPLLETLTAMLWLFNDGGKYDYLLDRAKNANFDCELGYSKKKGFYRFRKGLDFVENMSDSEFVQYLYFDLKMGKETEKYLDIIEKEYFDNYEELDNIRYINSCLERESHNYRVYTMELEKALEKNSDWDIASAYSNVIESVIENDPEKARDYFQKALPYLHRIEEWEKCGLGRKYIDFEKTLSS